MAISNLAYNDHASVYSLSLTFNNEICAHEGHYYIAI